MKITVLQDEDKAIQALKHASQWMIEAGLSPSDWWNPAKLSRAFFDPYAKSEEFYIAVVDGRTAACVILQDTYQNMQDWSALDRNSHPKALYIHYLAVEREFAGKGLPKALIDFAASLAKKKDLPVLRLDTDANEPNLTSLYEGLGFKQVKVLEDGGEKTALYERRLKN